MSLYVYQIMEERPHPNGYVQQEIVSRSVFCGDEVLLAKINLAVAETIAAWQKEQSQ